MQIVLLGATGFLGHHLLPSLSAAGHDCRVLSRYKPGCRELTIIPRVEVRQADIHDGYQLEKHFAGADAAINMVGILNESGRKGKGFRKAHVELTERVISTCLDQGVHRLVQVSALNAGKGSSYYLDGKSRGTRSIISHKTPYDLDG